MRNLVTIKNSNPHMKIGLGIPCHVNDIPLLRKYCLPKVLKLDPQPAIIIVSINDGKDGMKNIRTELYDYLFKECNCDIVLNLGADMMPSKNILKYVRRNIIVSYGQYYRRPIATIINIITRLLYTAFRRRPWRGTYSLPREIWFNQIRNSKVFSPDDESVKRAAKYRYVTVSFPKVLVVREHYKTIKQVILYHHCTRHLTLLGKILRLAQIVPL